MKALFMTHHGHYSGHLCYHFNFRMRKNANCYYFEIQKLWYNV